MKTITTDALLVKEGLLDIPVLYLSNHILRTKSAYYRLLQTVREEDTWEDWVLYLLEAVEQTAGQTIETIHAIKSAVDNALALFNIGKAHTHFMDVFAHALQLGIKTAHILKEDAVRFFRHRPYSAAVRVTP